MLHNRPLYIAYVLPLCVPLCGIPMNALCHVTLSITSPVMSYRTSQRVEIAAGERYWGGCSRLVYLTELTCHPAPAPPSPPSPSRPPP